MMYYYPFFKAADSKLYRFADLPISANFSTDKYRQTWDLPINIGNRYRRTQILADIASAPISYRQNRQIGKSATALALSLVVRSPHDILPLIVQSPLRDLSLMVHFAPRGGFCDRCEGSRIVPAMLEVIQNKYFCQSMVVLLQSPRLRPLSLKIVKWENPIIGLASYLHLQTIAKRHGICGSRIPRKLSGTLVRGQVRYSHWPFQDCRFLLE